MITLQTALVTLGVGSAVLLLALWLARTTSKISASNRSLLLTCAILAVAGFTLIPILTSPSQDGVEAAGAPTFGGPNKFVDLQDMAVARSEAPAQPGPLRYAGWVWAAGFVLLTGRLTVRLLAVARIVRLAHRDPLLDRHLASVGRELGLRNLPAIRISGAVLSPVVWGPPWPVLLVPEPMAGWSARRLRPVLLHELAHLKRLDGPMHLLSELLCCVFWFWPLMWIARSRLLSEQEAACDDFVLRRGVRPSDYCRLLLEVARRSATPERSHRPHLAALAMAGRPPLVGRVHAALDPARDRATPTRFVRTIAALSLGAVVAGTALYPHLSPASEKLDSAAAIARFLDPIVAEQMEEHGVVGSVVTIVQGDRVLFAKGYGKPGVESEAAVDPDRTIFRIGSISKVLTAVATLQLVDRGLVALDDDVNRHMTQFRIDDNFPEPIRVRHLLTHTSGFDQFGTGRHVTRREDEITIGEFLKDNLVRLWPPGSVSCYDTYGVTLAGHLVEVVSEKTFHDYIDERIFSPLGMTRSNIYVPERLQPDVAVGYAGDEPTPQPWEFMNTNPASTINSTARDMSVFMRMMLAGGEFDGKRILSESSTRAMFTRQFTNHPELPGYTYLMFEDFDHGVRAVSHGGSMTGYAALMYLLPENELGVFIALNRENGNFLHGVMQPLMQRLVESKLVRPELETTRQEPVDRFAGVYANNTYNHTRPEDGGWRPSPFVVDTDDEGRLEISGGACEQIGPLLFRCGDDETKVAFRENHLGEITYMLIRQNAYERLPMTVEEFLGPKLDEKAAAVYSGEYRIDELEITLSIFVEDGYLHSRQADKPSRRFQFLGDDRFEDAGLLVEFHVTDATASGFTVRAGDRELIGERVD